MEKEKLNWCAGFFDGEGSFSFAGKCPTITVVNTNPLAVSYFTNCMLEHGVEFKISERSKPSKSSKKKRWDLYLQGEEKVLSFIDLMHGKIYGKSLQMQLMKNFYSKDIRQKYYSYEKRINDFSELMKYYNQVNNIVIIDEKKLLEKLGFVPEINIHKINSLYEQQIKLSSFKDLDYFAGIIDAEGTYYINKRQNKHVKTNRYIPMLSFNNTNKEIISRCCSSLKNNNFSYHIQTRIPSKRNRIRWDVSIIGIKRTYNVCNQLKDKLVIKNKQNDLFIEYSKMRLNDYFGINKIGESFKESIEALNKEN